MRSAAALGGGGAGAHYATLRVPMAGMRDADLHGGRGRRAGVDRARGRKYLGPMADWRIEPGAAARAARSGIKAQTVRRRGGRRAGAPVGARVRRARSGRARG